jgi:hypothetical protein
LKLILDCAFSQAVDDVIEVPVLNMQLIDTLLEALDFGGMYHG